MEALTGVKTKIDTRHAYQQIATRISTAAASKGLILLCSFIIVPLTVRYLGAGAIWSVDNLNFYTELSHKSCRLSASIDHQLFVGPTINFSQNQYY
jgi:hypothetical protein